VAAFLLKVRISMSYSVNEMQKRIASMVDHNSDAPTEGGGDWNIRLKYLNMAQDEWAQFYDWQTLYKEYNTMTSTTSGNTSISLPDDYRKVAGYPKLTADGSTTDEFPQIRPQEREAYSSSDKFVELHGNPLDGYTLKVNPGTASGNLVSGASIFISYYASAQSLASATDVSQCPNPNYLVQRATAHVLEIREDDRFPIAKAEADKLLLRMLERENTHTEAEASTVGRIRTVLEKRKGFRLGRD